MEWTVVGVIVTLGGLAALIMSPVVKLNSTVTKLATLVDRLVADNHELSKGNAESHRRLWDDQVRQDDLINDHETRITVIERREDVRRGDSI
jgi:hypothetical protein